MWRSKLMAVNLKLPTAISMFFLYIFYIRASIWSENECLGNIQIYIISIILFFLFLGASTALLALIERKWTIKITRKISKITAFLMLMFGGYFLVNCYNNELDEFAHPAEYFRHLISRKVYVVVLVLFIVWIYSLIREAPERNNLRRGALALLIAFIQGWFMYAPNPFLDDMGFIYHIDAYTNSILNTLVLEPFEMYSSSIYGHHGLIYLIPVKMLHKLGFTNWMAVTIVIGIVGFITFSVEYWCISQIVKNDTIFTIAVLANAIVSFQIYPNQYYQMMPHRYLFQALIFCGCIIAYRKPKSIMVRVVMWFLSGVAMIWNIETGLVVMVVWCLAAVYLDSKAHGKYSVKTIILNVCYAIISFIGGFGVVNVYNLMGGGNIISVSTYIYPLVSRSYRVDMLQLSLMKPANGYFMVIAVMLGVIGLYLLDGLFIKLNEKQYMAILAAVMGLGVFTYYMNRAVTTNATIVCFSMVILLAHLCDRFVPFVLLDEGQNTMIKWKRPWEILKIRNIVGGICMIILSGMALASISTVGATLKNKITTTWNRKSIAEFMAEAKEKIPVDAVAFGPYTAQLYALLDKNTGIYIADWEDMGPSWANSAMNMNQEAFDKLEEILIENQYQHIVVSTNAVGYLPEGEYEEIESMEYNGYTFKVYERRL